MADTTILPVKRPAGERPPYRNPRRTTPEDSVTLPGYKKRKLNDDFKHDKVKAKLSSTTKSRETSSQESASKWFDKANEHVSQQQGTVARSSDETPFFMSRQPTYQTDNLNTSGSDETFGDQHRDDSENADLRGVIDDLTIENKRLKQLLKNTRRDSPSSNEQDKLFEIRVHGLPAPWKRELEHLLKTFTTNVHTSISSRPESSGTTQISPLKSGTTPGDKTTKSQALHTDSGYGSNSNSNSNSTLPSVKAPGDGRFESHLPRVNNRSKSIYDYLQNIPDTLRPRRAPAMTERTKMLLVVRKLEQLFTGKSAAPSGHSQTIQQQKVSQSAAKADRTEATKVKKVRYEEGSREARMFSHGMKVNLDAPDRLGPLSDQHSKSHLAPTSTPTDQPSSESRSQEPTEASISPDQRPTRPLDLDVNRAQVVTENVDYIRHLGFSPHLGTNDQLEVDSWLYLNLLSNMAQLHSLNVTPSFVRKAVKKLSTKFELSKDGHRVRWIGETSGTIFSKEDEQAIEAVNDVQAEPVEDSGTSGSSRSQTHSSSFRQNSSSDLPERTSNHQISNSSQRPNTTTTSQLAPQSSSNTLGVRSAFDYRPIVFNPQRFNQKAASYLDSPSVDESSGGDSVDLAKALSRSSLDQRHSEDGAITFFNNPFFYKDASFDLNPTNWKSIPDEILWPIIGLSENAFSYESPLRHHDACYFTPQFASKPYRPQTHEADLHFDLGEITAAGEDETQPLEFTASGVGGTIPAENFLLDVKVSRTSVSTPRPSPIRRVTFTGTRKRPNYVYTTAFCRKIDLLPSRLPPPSYVFFTSMSSSDISDDDMDESESSSSPERDDDPAAPASFFHQWSNSTSSYEGDESSLERPQHDDIARQGQSTVAAEFRQEKMVAPPHHAENHVDGSLAATVGASKNSSVMSIVSDTSDESDEEEEEEEEDDDREGEE